jgi:hypothetical protein
MGLFRSRVFGEVGVAADGAYVTREVAIGARSITRSLFLGMELEQGVLDRAAALVDTLGVLDVRARESIEANKSDVPAYVTFHLEELEDAVLQQLFGAERSRITRESFLARLDLVGVSVHALPPQEFSLVLDYSVGKSITDQILAVRFAPTGHPTSVIHES